MSTSATHSSGRTAPSDRAHRIGSLALLLLFAAYLLPGCIATGPSYPIGAAVEPLRSEPSAPWSTPGVFDIGER